MLKFLFVIGTMKMADVKSCILISEENLLEHTCVNLKARSTMHIFMLYSTLEFAFQAQFMYLDFVHLKYKWAY